MSLSLEQFIKEEQERLEKFKQWYENENKINPEDYPLVLPDGNEGSWLEMVNFFEPETE